MTKMRLFLDTHDKTAKTFPDALSRRQFAEFFAAYEEACRAEGVTLIRTHVGYGEGRAFCLTAAPDAEAVARAHQRVGLPFGEITEVETASPGDTFFELARQAG
jgi:hypothetical protein